MSQRLQVVLDDEEMREIREVAERERLTVSAWVRGALRTARREFPNRDSRAKLAAVREAARHQFPTGEIEEMLGDIERGYAA